MQEIALCFELGRATVVVTEDQLSLAIGKRGQNVRLAARLTGWDIDILTPAEYNKGLDEMEKALRTIPGVDDSMLDKMVAHGHHQPARPGDGGQGPAGADAGECRRRWRLSWLRRRRQLAPHRRMPMATHAVEKLAEEARGAEAVRPRRCPPMGPPSEAGQAISGSAVRYGGREEGPCRRHGAGQ